jgi:hypothetical protein
MPAILILEKMPKECRGGGCPFYKVCDICDMLSARNSYTPVYTPSSGKREDCPLIEIDGVLAEKLKRDIRIQDSDYRPLFDLAKKERE